MRESQFLNQVSETKKFLPNGRLCKTTCNKNWNLFLIMKAKKIIGKINQCAICKIISRKRSKFSMLKNQLWYLLGFLPKLIKVGIKQSYVHLFWQMNLISLLEKSFVIFLKLKKERKEKQVCNKIGLNFPKDIFSKSLIIKSIQQFKISQSTRR